MNFKIDKKVQSIIVYVSSILFIMIYNLLIDGSLYAWSKDGELYISIIDNFLSTGHFIQNARPYENNMIVSPGLPMIILIFKIIFGNINGVLFFQYILFGLLNVFLYNTCLNLYESKILSCLSVLIYCFSNAVLRDVASPKYILTETYTLCITSFLLYIISCKEKSWISKIKICLPILLICFFIRTVFSIWLIPVLIIAVVKTIQKEIDIKYLLKIAMITVLLITVNIIVNYRETKEFVLFQNYGGIPVYQANNPNTKTYGYSSTLAREFVEEDFFEITNSNLTTSEKSKILNNRAKKWMFENFGIFTKNTIIKFYKMFIKSYNFDFYIMIFISFFYIIKQKRHEFLVYVVMFSLMAIITSIGLNIIRYTYFIVPFYIVTKMGLLKEIYRNIKKII